MIKKLQQDLIKAGKTIRISSTIKTCRGRGRAIFRTLSLAKKIMVVKYILYMFLQQLELIL